MSVKNPEDQIQQMNNMVHKIIFLELQTKHRMLCLICFTPNTSVFQNKFSTAITDKMQSLNQMKATRRQQAYI